MKKIKYTQNEIKQLQNALNAIIDDLESLWRISSLEEISVPVLLHGFSSCYRDKEVTNFWRFIMDEQGIYLSHKDDRYRYILAKRIGFGKISKYLTIHEQDIIFMKEYKDIRKLIIEEIEVAKMRKKENLDIADQIANMYKKDAQIEIELPESLNKHQIEVQEEDGRKIGTLNFGSLSIKIITTGDIELVHKDKEKQKRK